MSNNKQITAEDVRKWRDDLEERGIKTGFAKHYSNGVVEIGGIFMSSSIYEKFRKEMIKQGLKK